MPKCPICGKTKSLKQDLIDHVENDHADILPKDISTAQYIYKLIHGRDYGLCRVCNKPTLWNEKAGKPYQLCPNPKCREIQRKKAKENMIKIYGKDTLLNDMDHQQKMLANRKISGTYRWSDNKHTFTYTGSYEKFAIEWSDKVMGINPDTIDMPGPVIEYDFNGETKHWITDMYYEDFNLIAEIKDGGFDKNTHEGFAHNRELEAAKDNYMRSQRKYNYIKITNKNMMSLVKIMSEIRLNNIFGDTKQEDKVFIEINESVTNDAEVLNEANYLNSSDIDAVCDKICEDGLDSTNEVMSVTNLSPIMTTGQFIERKEIPVKNEDAYPSLQDSGVMFGDGYHSAISDANTPNHFACVDEDTNEEESDQMFSNNPKGTWNPFDKTDNFKTIGEEVIADIQNDPSEPDDSVPSIASSIYKSNFLVRE